jgi:hypothetical protein
MNEDYFKRAEFHTVENCNPIEFDGFRNKDSKVVEFDQLLNKGGYNAKCNKTI